MKFDNWFERKLSTETLPKQNVEQPSRREFLTRSAKAIGGAIALSSLPEEAIAWTQEIKKDDSLKEGLIKLREEVFATDNEVGAIYIMNQDRKGAWIISEEGNRNSLIMVNRFEQTFEVVQRGGISKVMFMHTHPANDPDSTRLKRFTSTSKDNFIPISPPSFPTSDGVAADFSIFWADKINSLGVAVESKIIDARGLWTLSIDLNHGFIKKFNAVLQAFQHVISLIENEKDPTALSILVPELSSKVTGKRNPMDIFRSIVKHKGDVPSESLNAITKIVKDMDEVFEQYAAEYEILEVAAELCMKAAEVGEDPNLYIKKYLIPAYAGLGANVRFELWGDIN